ncbi:MAG: hypothetical protein HXY23_04510 [Parvularculaceae bacterium]|nr:hypothetical protein [Parvularculaceae bacterium]
MKKLLIAAFAATFTSLPAFAAPMTMTGVSFDTDNAVAQALWAQGGVTTGPAASRREACAGSGPPTGPNGIECRALEAQGFNLNTYVEIDGNGTAPDDVLSLLFPNPVVNGAGSCVASPNKGATGPTSAASYAGCDLLVFEILNQADNPTISLTLNGVSVLGVLLAQEGVNSTHVAIWGFDLTWLGVPVGDAANNPLFISREAGSPDVAAVVGLNVAAPVVPIPAAAWLFAAGLAGLGAAGRRAAMRRAPAA